jgi:hypothetical protein
LHVGVRLNSTSADANSVGFTSCSESADIDVIAARGEIASGTAANGEVVISDVTKKRIITDSSVVVSEGTLGKRVETVSCVPCTGRIARERTSSGGRVATTRRVLPERLRTVGRVGVAGCVAIEPQRSTMMDAQFGLLTRIVTESVSWRGRMKS